MKKVTASLVTLAAIAAGGLDFNGTTSVHSGGVVPCTYPITISLWARPAQTNNVNGAMFCAQTNIAGYEGSRISMWLLGSSGFAGQNEADRSDSSTRAYGGLAAPGVWQNIICVSTSETHRVIWADGVPKDTNTTAHPTRVFGGDAYSVGARFLTSWGQFYTGSIAEVAVWTNQLSDEACRSIGAGASPLLVYPNAPVWYAPLLRATSGLQSESSTITVTVTNGVAPTTHPKVVRP